MKLAAQQSQNEYDKINLDKAMDAHVNPKNGISMNAPKKDISGGCKKPKGKEYGEILSERF